MKIQDKKVKIGVYFAIEILYTIAMIATVFYVNSNFGTNNLYEEPMFNNIIIVLVMIIWIIGPMLSRYIVTIYVSLFTLYLVSQNVYFSALNQYYRFATAISLKSELSGVSDSVMEFINFDVVLPFIIIIVTNLAFVALYFLFQRNVFSIKFRIPYKLLFIFLALPVVNNHKDFITQIELTKNQEDVFQLNKTDYYIYTVIPNVNQFVDKFGLLTFAYRDFISLEETEIFSKDDFDEIASFLNNRTAPTVNDMTGIFKDKNIIFVQAESFMNVMVHPELTPTLFMMREKGINIKNFNTPTTPGSTSDTEFTANTSIMPNSEGYSVAYKYPYNTYPETLPALFKKEGYKTYAYHNNYGTFYNRMVIFPTFGYDSFFSSTELGLESMSSDKEVMDIMKWILLEHKSKYMGYWVTYSGHQPYELNEVGASEESVSKIKSIYPNLDDEYVSFWAKNMDLDESLGNLINLLEKHDRLDDFVIVVFGDHIVKGLDFGKDAAFYKQTGIKINYDDMYTGLYIFNSAIDSMEHKKVSTVLDFIPTFANLFDIEYNYKEVLGRDIFDPLYEGFHYSEWSLWETDNFKYNIIDDEYILSEGYSQKSAEKEMDYYLHMKEICRKILKLDYFGQK